MRPMSSKSKGNTYERKIAKVFTNWWGHDHYRVPASGALNWASDMNISGDITTIPEAHNPFVMELKNRQTGNWTLESVVLGVHDVHNWWAQVVRDATETHKVPLLIFTRNRAKDFIMLPYSDFIYTKFENADLPSMVTTIHYKNETTDTIYYYRVFVSTLDSFMSFEPKFWKDYYPYNVKDKSYTINSFGESWSKESFIKQETNTDETSTDDIMQALEDNF